MISRITYRFYSNNKQTARGQQSTDSLTEMCQPLLATSFSVLDFAKKNYKHVVYLILRHPEKYHVYHTIKLGDYNVGRTEQIFTLPLYMAFLLTEL